MKTTTLTIRREGTEFVARDAKGVWHGRGRIDLCIGHSGMDLARSLFHPEEIAAVRVLADGTTEMDLYTMTTSRR